MMEEDFYATIKLKTGEEIFCKTSVLEENDKTLLLISNPIIIGEMDLEQFGISGYKIESWLKTTSEDMFIINLDDVLTITENNDMEMIIMYNNYLKKSSKPKSSSSNKEVITKKMGYISNIKEAKEYLEKLFKNS